jgi:hypothetical protein
MNNLELTAHKAYTTHKAACSEWNNGKIEKTWLDENHVLCIQYANGKWWHYDVDKFGNWMWW